MQPASAKPATARGDEVEAGRNLGLGHSELGAARPDRQAGVRLRGNVRIEAQEDVDRWATAPPDTDSPGQPGQRVDLVGGLDRKPAQRVPVGCRLDGSPEVGIGLADALERDLRIGQSGPPGDGPFTARYDRCAGSCRGRRRADDRGNVVGLDGVVTEPRIREAGAQLLAGGRYGCEIRDVTRRPEAACRLPEPVSDRRQPVVGRAGHP
jgi:hypothetical protein